MKRIALAASVMLLLPACKTAPVAIPPAQVACPAPPPLAKVPLGPSFLEQMQSFLSGSLPEQTSSEKR